MTGRFRTTSRIAVLLLAGCAQVEPPPGGPEDRVPPAILVTRPEANAIVPDYDGVVVFVFDERISERDVETSVLVSPRTSPVEVRHGRDEIEVSLRRGWEPGHIYHVTLQPRIRDLFGNALAGVETLVFSTGPEIPNTTSSGVVIDRLTGRSQSGLRVEAIRTADSLVYAVPTDSAGAYLLRQFPAGEYEFRAFEDVNQNRSLEAFEPRDSAFVAIVEGEPVEVDFRILAPDSTPPTAGSPVLRGNRIEIGFDDNLDPDQDFEFSRVSVVGSSGDTVGVTGVTIGPGARILPPPEPGDTAGGPRLPSRTLFVELDDSVTMVPASEYVVRLSGIRNVNGLAAEVEVTVTTPPPIPGSVALVSPLRSRRYIARRRAGRRARLPNHELRRG